MYRTSHHCHHMQRVMQRVALALTILAFPLTLHAQQAAATPQQATIVGTVFDSVTKQPLPGATIQLVQSEGGNAAFSVITDSTGSFVIAHVARGHYVAGFLDPTLDEMGLSTVQAPVVVGADTLVHITLAVPSPRTVHQLLCGAAADKDSSGALVGFVRDADRDIPIPGSMVVATWQELVIDARGLHRDRREVPSKTNDIGWFALCGFPTDGPVSVRAELGKRGTGFIEVSVPPRGVLVRDFELGSDTVVADTGSLGTVRRIGTSRITGLVEDPAGKPLPAAHVTVWGTTASAVTDADGRFVLDSLPSGTEGLDVRALGFEPKRVAVDLARGRALTVQIRLDKTVPVLAGVRVYGKRSSSLDDFLRRRQSGAGYFITAQDISNKKPYDVSDLFYTIPGVRVEPTGAAGYAIVTTRDARPCQLAVYVDGMLMTGGTGSNASPGGRQDNGTFDLNSYVRPDDVRGIEVYNDETTAPVQYRSSACGSILIWTK